MGKGFRPYYYVCSNKYAVTTVSSAMGPCTRWTDSSIHNAEGTANLACNNYLSQVAAAGITSIYPLLQSIFLSGLSFYIYNEASFVALSQLAPVTHSVVNTLKRVIIILVSCAVFQVILFYILTQIV